MKTKLLVFAFSMLMSIFLHAQTTAIPDVNFEQALIDLNIDKDNTINGSVATADISGVTSLNVRSKNISDLTGIQDFSSLIQLDCSYNQLTSLNVTQNSALTQISVYENQLTTLDVSQNNALTILTCPGNQLTTLDVSQNLDLTSLVCGDNQLTTLDVSQNLDLTNLRCAGNQLTTLDVTQAPNLQSLYCSSNQLTSLDVSQNTNLTELGCGSNQLTSLNISQNTLLQIFNCSNNQLTTLDISQNTMLGNLNCSNNYLTNLSLNPSITYLTCSNNQIQSLDLSQNTYLYLLECEYNQLKSIDVSHIFNIHDLICNNNLLTYLNLKNGNNWGLQQLIATNNPSLSCIDVDNVNDANSFYNWEKDDTATYSEDCSAMSVDEFGKVSFLIYPNPINDLLYISLNEPADYLLINLNGQILKKGKIKENENTLNVSNLPIGLYFLKIRTDKGGVTSKLIKQ